MPLYSYISDDGYEYEHICSYEERPETIEIDGVVFHYRMAPVARLSSWETEPFGVNGRFDPNIGKTVYSWAEKNREYEKRGLETLSHSNKHLIEDRINKKAARHKELTMVRSALKEVSAIKDSRKANERYQDLLGAYDDAKIKKFDKADGVA